MLRASCVMGRKALILIGSAKQSMQNRIIMTDTAPTPISTSESTRYKRVLLKISGEALMGDQAYGHDQDILNRICEEIRTVTQKGVQVCLVVGGGNIYRGMSGAEQGMERASADYMGMLATVLNALAVQNGLEKLGVDTRVLSAIQMMEICESYIRRRALRHLERGRVVIFAGGTGNPFFTTDSAASLRAIEIGAQILLKATKVDGVYTDDPVKNPDAKRYDRLGYDEAINRKLAVMDATALVLCRDHNMPLRVFDLQQPGNLGRVLAGEHIGTLVE